MRSNEYGDQDTGPLHAKGNGLGCGGSVGFGSGFGDWDGSGYGTYDPKAAGGNEDVLSNGDGPGGYW